MKSLAIFLICVAVTLSGCASPDRGKQIRSSEQNITNAVRSQSAAPVQSNRMSIDDAKKKCAELGFEPATEGYKKCALQLSN